MTPPPIEIAPAETFKPFADFTNRVCEIFEKQIVEALTAERDEWKARCEFSFEQRDKLTAERDALKAAARLALDALECSEAYVGCESWSPSMLREIQQVIAALKAVL